MACEARDKGGLGDVGVKVERVERGYVEECEGELCDGVVVGIEDRAEKRALACRKV